MTVRYDQRHEAYGVLTGYKNAFSNLGETNFNFLAFLKNLSREKRKKSISRDSCDEIALTSYIFCVH